MFHVKRRLYEEADPEAQGGGGGAPADQAKSDPTAELAARLDRMAEDDKRRDEVLARLFQQRPQQQPQNNEDQKRQFAERFFNDPATALSQVGQLAEQRSYERMRRERFPQDVEAAKAAVREANPKLFDRYKDEIQQRIQDDYDAAHWTNKGAWEQAFNAVQVKHFDEIAKERLKATDTDGPAVPSLRQQKPREDTLSDEDARDAKKLFRMTPDETKGALKAWQKDKSDPAIGDDMLDSAWANVITFDSDVPPKDKVVARAS